MGINPEPLPLKYGYQVQKAHTMRFIIIIAIIAYVLYKVGSFLFKIGAASQHLRNNPPSGNVNPGNGAKQKKKPNVQGEYIDYEEVK